MHRLPAPIPCTVRARGAVPRPVPAATFGNQSPEQLLHGCGSVREQQSCGISSINPCRRPLPGNCPGLPLKHLAAGVAVLMGTGAGCSSSQEDDSSLPPRQAGKHHERSRAWGRGRKTPVKKFRWHNKSSLPLLQANVLGSVVPEALCWEGEGCRAERWEQRVKHCLVFCIDVLQAWQWSQLMPTSTGYSTSWRRNTDLFTWR